MSEGDLEFPASSMGQAITVLADIVCSYVSSMQPQGCSPGDDLKTLHQVAISIFLHQLLMRSQHKTEMAGILDAIAAELRDQPDRPGETAITPNQVKYMVDRFLGWRLPKDFNPDAGISYTRPNYEPNVDATPSGTNLFDASQAAAMVRHMVEGMPGPEQLSDTQRPEGT
jgi:hypothetical protein